MYSMLSELEDCWTATADPPLLETMQVRNLPFYNIQLSIEPVGSVPLLGRSKIAIFLFQLLGSLVNPDYIGWPEMLMCRLEVGNSRLLIGNLNVTLIEPAQASTSYDSTESEKSTYSHAGGAALNVTSSTIPMIVNSTSLGTGAIDVHRTFTGTTTTDKSALYLFSVLLGSSFTMYPQDRLAYFCPPVSLVPTYLKATPLNTYGL